MAWMFIHRVAWRHRLICSLFERQCSCSLCPVEVMANFTLQTWSKSEKREITRYSTNLRVEHPTRRWPRLLGIWQAHSSLIAQFSSFVLRPHYDLVDIAFNTITTYNKCPINTGFTPLPNTMHFSAFQTAISCVRLRSASHAWSHSLLRRNICIFAGKMYFKSSGNTVAQKFSSVLSFESEGLLLTQETLD